LKPKGNLKPTSEEEAEFIFKLMNTPQMGRKYKETEIQICGNAKDYIENKMQRQLERLGYYQLLLLSEKWTRQKLAPVD